MSEETKETSESEPVPQTHIAEDSAKKGVGDQGMYLEPIPGYDTDPFASQDVIVTPDNPSPSPEPGGPDTTDSSGPSTPEGE